MKIKATIDIYTTQSGKIEEDKEFFVDYFDDNNGKVWLKEEGKEMPAGNTYVTLACFENFFKILFY